MLLRSFCNWMCFIWIYAVLDVRWERFIKSARIYKVTYLPSIHTKSMNLFGFFMRRTAEDAADLLNGEKVQDPKLLKMHYDLQR